MAFCITVGTHDFMGRLEGYENVTAQCHNCGNWSAQIVTEWPFFTVCFIPLVPLAFHKYKLVACPVCNFKQDLSIRPDVLSQGPGGGPVQQGPPGPGPGPQPGQGFQQQGYHMQGPPQVPQGQPPPGGQDYYGGQGFKGPAV